MVWGVDGVFWGGIWGVGGVLHPRRIHTPARLLRTIDIAYFISDISILRKFLEYSYVILIFHFAFQNYQ